RAQLGRVLSSEDDAPGAPLRVALSHGFWTSALAADPRVVGRTLSMDGSPAEIVGVLEPNLTLPGAPASRTPDIWRALQIDRAGSFANSHVFPGIARLTPASTPADAVAEMERLTPELAEAFPDAYSGTFFERYGFRTVAVPLKEHVLGDMARNLWLL